MSSQPTPNSIRALAEAYSIMPEKDPNRRIAQMILANLSEITTQNLENAAALCQVSASTLQRFCRELGFGTFSNFKQQLADDRSNYMFRNYVDPRSRSDQEQGGLSCLIQNLTAELSLLDRKRIIDLATTLCQRLHTSRMVYLHDVFFSHTLGYLQADLAVTGIPTICAASSASQLSNVQNMTDQDTVLFHYDGSERSKSIIQQLYLARQRGAYIAVIAHGTVFQYAECCNLILSIGESSSAWNEQVKRDLVYLSLSLVYKGLFIAAHLHDTPL